MAFTVQNDQGSVTGANAYVDVAFFKAYHEERGNTFVDDDEKIEQAIIKATDYLDHRFNFVGSRSQGRSQTTEWPRRDAWDVNEDLVNGIPVEVKEACCEYALIAQQMTLNPTPTRDASGAAIQAKSESVGPISRSVTYVGGAAFSMPKYPVADSRLKRTGLVISGGTFQRA